jgi:hypothetical protein
MKTGLLVLGWIALVGSVAGCSTPEFCEPLKKCGGNYLLGEGDWGGDGVLRAEWVVASPEAKVASASAACVDQVQNPTQPPSLAKIPARPAGVRAVEPTTLNWCADLRFSADGNISVFDDGWYETLVKYRGWFPGIELQSARLAIGRNNQYQLDTEQRILQQYELPRTCMYAQGVRVSCEDFTEGLNSYVSDRLEGLDKVGVKAQIYGTTCSARPNDDGCNCQYYLGLIATTTGPYAQGSGELTFFDSAASPPSRTDFCVEANRLQLTGHNDSDLFNRTALKTLQFDLASCNDGVKTASTGETGVDCGGSCGACP